ncbi:MAG: hypothetical protein GYA50_06185 [Eubacteriaceae bacterium]|nr:hypothetical protein [Eubacteriaceae bacterium]
MANGDGIGYKGGEGKALSGPVEIMPPLNANAEQIKQVKLYIKGANKALREGYISPIGRVSTKGDLRIRASKAAGEERERAAIAGTPYKGHVGHVPDTTWTGTAQPHSFLDLDAKVNSSIGGQANGYPIGYKATKFIYKKR